MTQLLQTDDGGNYESDFANDEGFGSNSGYSLEGNSIPHASHVGTDCQERH